MNLPAVAKSLANGGLARKWATQPSPQRTSGEGR